MQLPLNFNENIEKWPDHDLFPLNIRSLDKTVKSVIEKDIENSEEFILLTGFTSLSNLIDLFGSNTRKLPQKTKIVIGFEPNLSGRKHYGVTPLEKEIKEYWLKQGLSIMQGGSIMNLINKIEKGKIQFRFKDKLHAKIYVGDSAATIGSSNFSKNGLSIQVEANARFVKSKDNTHLFQYNSLKKIAENYYNESTNYNDEIVDLLKNLIATVTWQEALARAIAELIDGDWMDEYKAILSKFEDIKLWPSQLKGIAQAISILQKQSNVLIADPTGAGKTKLCTSLILALKHWLYQSGENYKTNSLTICPPLVVEKWESEFSSLKRMDNKQISMGLLSNASIKNKQKVKQNLSYANILTIDEAHNYLSSESNRTNIIKSNKAEFKILATATPISKRIEDVLKLIELLDIDNLSDEDFGKYKDLVNKPYYSNNDNENIESLRNFVSKFTVRRTKKFLNKEIDKEIDKYQNRLGKTCRFPEQKEKSYKTKENEKDREIVEKINILLDKLKGITYLTNFNKPNFEITTQESKQGYINRRVSSSRALSIYMIRSTLRSSNVALIEHIEGSNKAMELFGFKGKTNLTGNKIQKISEIINKAKLPKKNQIFNDVHFPSWLINKEEYIKTCQEELSIYEEISKLALELSGDRELGKLDKLVELLDSHENILAFDSTVITLYYLQKLFKEHYSHIKLLVATGNDRDNESIKVIEQFSLTSENEGKCIALCSDKMSESIDLQKASCVLLLDLPSVLRVVEQRIGRVDRMDSFHQQIEIYWPDDSKEFSLSTDSKLIRTNDLVDELFGSNFEIPKQIKDKHFTNTDSTDSIIKEYKEFVDKDESWSGIHDSFQSVIDLKEGDKALIQENVYEEFINVSSTVKTRVSFIESKNNWCFLAMKGDVLKSPRWYFIDENNNIESDISEVCKLLRENITHKNDKLEWNDVALKTFINKFKDKSRDLLPPKKKRALDVAKYLIEKKVKNMEGKDIENREYYYLMKNLNHILNNNNDEIDYEKLSERFIVLLQPYIDKKRQESKRKRVVYNLSNLKSEYKYIELKADDLKDILDKCTLKEDFENNIAACIIGVGK